MEEILVTGATGFLGKAFIRHLLQESEQRYNIVCFARSAKNVISLKELFGDRVSVKVGDLGSDESVGGLVNSADVIVHSAAYMAMYKEDSKKMFDINVGHTKRLVEAFFADDSKADDVKAPGKKSKKRRFIYISSTEAMGPSIDGTEESKLNPTSTYGQTKVEAEKAIRELFDAKCKSSPGFADRFEYIILRPTGIMGREDRYIFFESLKAIYDGLVCFVPPGCEKNSISYTHVDDVVQGMALSLSRKLPAEALNQTYIICLDKAVTWEQSIRTIAELMNRRLYSFISLPLPLLKSVIQVAGVVFNIGKDRVGFFDPAVVDDMTTTRTYSNAKAKKLLGFKPKFDFRSGVSQVISEVQAKDKLFKPSSLSTLEIVVLVILLILLIYLVW